MNQEKQSAAAPISRRFRGFLPVVVDVETGGFNPDSDALLEVAAIIIDMNDAGELVPAANLFHSIQPFEGANTDPASLLINGIDLQDPGRRAVDEKEGLREIFREISRQVKKQGCTRAIMVAHNASFDLSFIKAAAGRQNLKRNPFHPFSSFDTATLSGLAYGQTVLSRACETAGIAFNPSEAHSALYDCKRTAELFCRIVNAWKNLGGWEAM